MLRDLRSVCGFCAAFNPESPPPGHVAEYKAFEAIWDTGATGSVISQRIIDACGLKPTGMVQAHGVDGIHDTETFLVNIGLPNAVVVHTVEVTRGKLPGFDALIGMNIITLGDFAVTNKDNKTVFSFRIPSAVTIDFMKEDKKIAIAARFQHGGSHKHGKKKH